MPGRTNALNLIDLEDRVMTIVFEADTAAGWIKSLRDRAEAALRRAAELDQIEIATDLDSMADELDAALKKLQPFEDRIAKHTSRAIRHAVLQRKRKRRRRAA